MNKIVLVYDFKELRAGGRVRTDDLEITNHPLYQLSYSGLNANLNLSFVTYSTFSVHVNGDLVCFRSESNRRRLFIEVDYGFTQRLCLLAYRSLHALFSQLRARLPVRASQSPLSQLPVNIAVVHYSTTFRIISCAKIRKYFQRTKFMELKLSKSIQASSTTTTPRFQEDS